MKRIAVLGEIGSGNLGDDLGYLLIRDALTKAFDNLDILADIRPMTPNLFGLLDSYHWDAVIAGCGTLLDLGDGVYMRALLGAAGRCPVAILGSGVADSRHIRPTEVGRKNFHRLMEVARYAWLRAATDEITSAVLTPDPGWLYGWRGGGDRSGVGINVGYAAFSTMKLDPEFLHVLATVRSETAHPTALVSAWRGDHAWLERLKRGSEEPIYSITGTRKSTKVLSGFHVVLATRVHLAVLSACHGAVPILPEYTNKTRDVFAGVTVSHLIVPANVNVEVLLAAIDSIPAASTGPFAVEQAQAQARARIEAAAVALAAAW